MCDYVPTFGRYVIKDKFSGKVVCDTPSAASRPLASWEVRQVVHETHTLQEQEPK